MIIIDTAAVTALLVVVALAGLVGLVALGTGLVHTLVANRPVRLARHESVARYYGHLASGH